MLNENGEEIEVEEGELEEDIDRIRPKKTEKPMKKKYIHGEEEKEEAPLDEEITSKQNTDKRHRIKRDDIHKKEPTEYSFPSSFSSDCSSDSLSS